MKIKLTIAALFFVFISHAQIFLTGIGTKWSDEFTEWNVYTDDEVSDGEITMRWQMQGDWTEWDYTIGDESGSIKLKWRDDPSVWEISGGDDLITARMLWKGDPSEWRITNNSETVTLKSRWSNNINEWRLKNSRYGDFDMSTNWDNDPREWNIEDDLDEEISIHMKMAIAFLVTFHSSPRE